ncbi:MAG: hypothetical protein PHI23_05115, partial [Candidatus Peribacteraceae bacterium]|nr:hypothetical protein [Candidatus Peribacteraceae bacterium]
MPAQRAEGGDLTVEVRELRSAQRALAERVEGLALQLDQLSALVQEIRSRLGGATAPSSVSVPEASKQPVRVAGRKEDHPEPPKAPRIDLAALERR